jgi:hypothetical protein
MKQVASGFLAIAFSISTVPAFAQCQAIGWRLVNQRLISPSERYCEWEKNGVTTSRIVSGFCPFSPC